MDLSKVDGVLNWPAPTSVKELRGFLGLSAYYRRFIQHYGVMARSLIILLKKRVAWTWTDKEQEAVIQLK